MPGDGPGYEVVVADARPEPTMPRASEAEGHGGEEQALLSVPPKPPEDQPDAPTPAAAPQTPPEVAMTVEPLLTPVGVDQLFANPALLPKLDQPLPDIARFLGEDTPSDTSEALPEDGASHAASTPLAGAFSGSAMPGPAPAVAVTAAGESAGTAAPSAATAVVPQGQALREAVAGDEQTVEAVPADNAGEETAALPAAGPQTAPPLALGFAAMPASSSESPAIVTGSSAEPQAGTPTVIVPPAGTTTSTTAAGATTPGLGTSGTPTGTNLAALAGVLPQVPGQTTTADTTPSSGPTSAADAQNLLGNLPIRFEANQGQFNSQTQFVAHAPSYDLYLGSTQSSFVLPGPTTQDANGDTVPGGPGAVVNVQLVGANTSAQASGVNQLVTRTNYLIGNDQSQWVTNVPNYAGVQYSNVYNGVNLSYYESQGNLEHDFIVSPGANPNQIVSQFSGAQQLSLDAQGNLVIQTATGSLVEQRPMAYQEVNGTRVAVASNFVLQGDQVRFALGQYDTSQTLVIDPTWVYSSYFGGPGDETANGIDVDSTGAAYIVGSSTDSANLPGIIGANWIPNTLGTAGTDVFVAKVAKGGNSLVYLTILAGSDTTNGHVDIGKSIAVASTGAAYITGYTNSQSFPVSVAAAGPPQTYAAWQAQNAFDPAGKARGNNAFVAQLTPDGTTAVFCTYLGGAGNDYGYSIALDPSGKYVWVAGQVYWNTTSFNTAPNGAGKAMALKSIGDRDAVDALVARLTADTGTPNYLAAIGGTGNDEANSIAVDTNGNAYITGYTTSKGKVAGTAFPTTLGAFQSDLLGSSDAFVAEINTGGLVDSTYFGGANADVGRGIALDPANNIYIVGATTSGVTPFGSGAKTITPTAIGTSGGSDAFVARFDNDCDPTVAPYFVLIAGTKNDYGFGIAVQPDSNPYMVYITGQTYSDTTDGFPLPSGLRTVNTSTPSDAFVGMLNPALAPGKSLVFNTLVGGSKTDAGFAVAADTAGNVYAAGATLSDRLRPRAGTAGFQNTYGGGTGWGDAFVVEISPNPAGVAPPKMGAFNNNPNDAAGTPLMLTVSAQTYDGNPPTYYLNGAPAGASIDPNYGVFTWTPTVSQVGTWTFDVEADDAEGRYADQTVTVTVNLPPTSTTVTSSLNPSTSGQPVTFTAVVSPTPGLPIPTGTVTFLDGTATLGTATLAVVNNQDVANYTTSTLAAGGHDITAIYGGDGTFSGSSASLSQVVGQNPCTSSTTSLTSSASPSLGGQSVTLTATVQGGGTPSGTVTFYDGSAVLGTGTLAQVGGQMQATYTSASLVPGSHPLTAVYSGDSTYTPSTAESMQLVDVSQTATDVSSDDNPAVAGDNITFTAVVTSALGSPPTGSVNFMDGATLLGTVTLDGTGQATFATSSLALGDHFITAVYTGNGLTAPSTSGVLDQTIT